MFSWPALAEVKSWAAPFGHWVLSNTTPSLADRAATYEVVRQGGGVARAHDGSVLLTNYATIRRVFLDNETFSHQWFAQVNPDLGGLDGEANEPLRTALAVAFSQRALAGRADWIRSVARATLERMAARDERDLTTAFAAPFAYRISADLFGLGDVPIDDVTSWEPHLWVYASEGASGDAAPDRAFRAAARHAYERAARDEGADGLGALAHMPRAMVSPEAFERSLASMFLAGGQAVSASVYEVLRALIDYPEAAAEVRADRSRGPAFVDEVLRLTPQLWTRRDTTRATELEGLAIDPGTRIYCLIEAANRDPAAFEAPDTFRMGRSTRHFTFGLGPHYCVGHRLGREELVAALDLALDTWPSLRDAVDERTRRAGPNLGRTYGALTLREPLAL